MIIYTFISMVTNILALLLIVVAYLLSVIYKMIVRYMVYAYHVLFLLILRCITCFIRRPVLYTHYAQIVWQEPGDILDDNPIPKFLRGPTIYIINGCVNAFKVNAESGMLFLSWHINMLKLVCLMNCSCQCRLKRRLQERGIYHQIDHGLQEHTVVPIKQQCNCCFRHNDQMHVLYMYIAVSTTVITYLGIWLIF
jgi:hypothetical protein